LDQPGVRYASSVVAVGEQAPAFFDAGIVVFFAEGAPDELAEFSVLHRPTVTDGGLAPGDRIHLGGHTIAVLAVGEVANENLRNLGHLSLKRNGEHQAALPGDVCCDVGPIPTIEPGHDLVIVAGEGAIAP
jgi:glucitol/sorbitol PTS system EIIA component